MQTAELSAVPAGISEAERAKVLLQMNRLLESHQFKNSRRYPALLRFIVEETLEGRGEFLKERLLGVRVFDRPADYDTAADPIVRVTIAEIRKRIAQYYHDEEHDAEIRIELMPGRYAPEFRLRREMGSATWDHAEPVLPPAITLPAAEIAVAAAVVVAAPAVVIQEPVAPARPRRRRWMIWSGAAFAVALMVGLLAYHWFAATALDQMWAPVLASKRPVLFCLPTDVGKKRVFASLMQGGATDAFVPSSSTGGVTQILPVGPTFLDHESLGENVVYSDMLATLDIVNVLMTRHRDYHVRLNVATSLDDLRHGPAVLIGGLDNQWTLRALATLPYRFAGSDDDTYWISDTRNPGNRTWSLDPKAQYAAVTRDYALIARLHNEQTGQPEMIVAGIGMSGTAAAGEMISDEQRMDELRQRIGPGFKDHDFEVVISTDVVNGIAGSPKILAVAVW